MSHARCSGGNGHCIESVVDLVETIRAPKPEVDNSRICLDGSVPANDWASCEKALNALIRDWIKLWQKLGGLPKYLPRKAR